MPSANRKKDDQRGFVKTPKRRKSLGEIAPWEKTEEETELELVKHMAQHVWSKTELQEKKLPLEATRKNSPLKHESRKKQLSVVGVTKSDGSFLENSHIQLLVESNQRIDPKCNYVENSKGITTMTKKNASSLSVVPKIRSKPCINIKSEVAESIVDKDIRQNCNCTINREDIDASHCSQCGLLILRITHAEHLQNVKKQLNEWKTKRKHKFGRRLDVRREYQLHTKKDKSSEIKKTLPDVQHVPQESPRIRPHYGFSGVQHCEPTTSIAKTSPRIEPIKEKSFYSQGKTRLPSDNLTVIIRKVDKRGKMKSGEHIYIKSNTLRSTNSLIVDCEKYPIIGKQLQSISEFPPSRTHKLNAGFKGTKQCILSHTSKRNTDKLIKTCTNKDTRNKRRRGEKSKLPRSLSKSKYMSRSGNDAKDENVCLKHKQDQETQVESNHLHQQQTEAERKANRRMRYIQNSPIAKQKDTVLSEQFTNFSTKQAIPSIFSNDKDFIELGENVPDVAYIDVSSQRVATVSDATNIDNVCNTKKNEISQNDMIISIASGFSIPSYIESSTVNKDIGSDSSLEINKESSKKNDFRALKANDKSPKTNEDNNNTKYNTGDKGNVLYQSIHKETSSEEKFPALNAKDNSPKTNEDSKYNTADIECHQENAKDLKKSISSNFNQSQTVDSTPHEMPAVTRLRHKKKVSGNIDMASLLKTVQMQHDERREKQRITELEALKIDMERKAIEKQQWKDHWEAWLERPVSCWASLDKEERTYFRQNVAKIKLGIPLEEDEEHVNYEINALFPQKQNVKQAIGSALERRMNSPGPICQKHSSEFQKRIFLYTPSVRNRSRHGLLRPEKSTGHFNYEHEIRCSSGNKSSRGGHHQNTNILTHDFYLGELVYGFCSGRWESAIVLGISDVSDIHSETPRQCVIVRWVEDGDDCATSALAPGAVKKVPFEEAKNIIAKMKMYPNTYNHLEKGFNSNNNYNRLKSRGLNISQKIPSAITRYGDIVWEGSEVLAAYGGQWHPALVIKIGIQGDSREYTGKSEQSDNSREMQVKLRWIGNWGKAPHIWKKASKICVPNVSLSRSPSRAQSSSFRPNSHTTMI